LIEGTMAQTVFNVGMTCDGCANAVKRILIKVDGVSNVETNVETKKVIVTADGNATPEAMLEKLQKWSKASGKSVALA